MASEKIVGLRRSFDSSALAAWNFWVAADSMACDGLLLVCGTLTYAEHDWRHRAYSSDIDETKKHAFFQKRRLNKGRIEKKTTYRGGPDTRNGHVIQPLPDEVHGQALCQDAHADLAHGVGRLASEEAAVDGRTDDDDTAAPLALEVRERGVKGQVEALWVHALHELEAFGGRVFDRGPPDCARVVD